MPLRVFLGACIVILLAAGCASRPVQLNAGHSYGADLDDSHSWHQVRFNWRWPPETQPRWSLDLLAAHRIMSQIITEHHRALPLWRFHRRAARDAAGHQFSFIFYSPDAVAGRIHEAVEGHPVTGMLMEHGLLERVRLTSPTDPEKLLATSDPSWPGELQTTWPMFIMGVSQTWLGLIEVHAGRGAFSGDLDKELQRYDEVNETLSKVWYEYAQHAFFHHLSGVFGYQPMLVRKRMRF